ncbi:MAG: PAS domain S-box protein [Firmicutes bacterium]|nr:PAS domain S-box protein [Bacillota bacterium]
MKDSSSKQPKEAKISPRHKTRSKKDQRRSILESYRQLINIINLLPDATFVINREGEVIAWNKAIEEMTGAPAKEILGKKNYSTLFYPVERPMLIDLAINPDETIESQYSNFKRKGGTLQAELFVKVAYGIGMAYLWGGATVLYDNDGNVIGAIESFRDLTQKKKYELASRGAERWFASMISFLPDAMFAIDKRGRVIAWNRAMEKMTGVRTDEIIGKGDQEYSISFFGERRHMLIDLVLNSDPSLESAFNKLIKDNLIYTAEDEANVSYSKQKACLWGQASPLYDDKGSIVGAIESLRDITEIKQLEYSLRESERRLSDIIDFLPDATLVIDIEGRVIAWNQAAEDLTGVRAKDILGKGDNEYAIPFYGYKKPILIDLVLKGDDELERSYPYLERKGKVLIGEFNCSAVKGGGAYLRATASPLYDSSGKIVGAIEQIRDATNQKRTEEQMKYIGLYDALTGLYNRAYFEEEMHRLRHGRTNSPIGMVMLDIDGLKRINESFGHEAGDKLLRDTSDLIRGCFRPGDVIARTGGDEFTAILTNIDEQVLEKAVERIRTRVEGFNAQDPAFPLSVSIGIAVGDEDNADIYDLFKKADNNVYREKLRKK